MPVPPELALSHGGFSSRSQCCPLPSPSGLVASPVCSRPGARWQELEHGVLSAAQPRCPVGGSRHGAPPLAPGPFAGRVLGCRALSRNGCAMPRASPVAPGPKADFSGCGLRLSSSACCSPLLLPGSGSPALGVGAGGHRHLEAGHPGLPPLCGQPVWRGQVNGGSGGDGGVGCGPRGGLPRVVAVKSVPEIKQVGPPPCAGDVAVRDGPIVCPREGASERTNCGGHCSPGLPGWAGTGRAHEHRRGQRCRVRDVGVLTRSGVTCWAKRGRSPVPGEV